MAFYSELTLNITAPHKLVTSPQQPTPLPESPRWYVGEVREIKICFVRAKPSGAGKVDVVSGIGVALRVFVGDPGVTAITSATAGAAVDDVYTLTLPLNLPDVAAFVGTLPSRTTKIQFELTGASTVVNYQAQIEICSPVGTVGLVDPEPPDIILGIDMGDSRYVPQMGPPGGSFVMTSPNGLQTRIYRGDDGEIHFEDYP